MIEISKNGNKTYVTCDISMLRKNITETNKLPKGWFELPIESRTHFGVKKLHACNAKNYILLLLDNKDDTELSDINLSGIKFFDLLNALEHLNKEDAKYMKLGVVPKYMEEQFIVAAVTGVDSVVNNEISSTIHELINREGCFKTLELLQGLL